MRVDGYERELGMTLIVLLLVPAVLFAMRLSGDEAGPQKGIASPLLDRAFLETDSIPPQVVVPRVEADSVLEPVDSPGPGYDRSYPPDGLGDVNCDDIRRRVQIVDGHDPYRLDGNDKNGIGCQTYPWVWIGEVDSLGRSTRG